MGRAIRPDDFVSKRRDNGDSRRVSSASRDLANYIADMLHSLRTCAKSPDLKVLESLLHDAEIEACKISGVEKTSAQTSRRIELWQQARLARD